MSDDKNPYALIKRTNTVTICFCLSAITGSIGFAEIISGGYAGDQFKEIRGLASLGMGAVTNLLAENNRDNLCRDVRNAISEQSEACLYTLCEKFRKAGIAGGTGFGVLVTGIATGNKALSFAGIAGMGIGVASTVVANRARNTLIEDMRPSP